MADKLLISNLTWRSLEMQRFAYPEMPFFIVPDEITSLIRPTQRMEKLNIHVISYAVIADNEKDFLSFIKSLPKGTEIHSKEEAGCIGPTTPIKKALICWKAARKFGAAKVGGRISAAKRQDESKKACAKIADRWPLPNKIWTTPTLLIEADISYNTAIKFLGKRPIAQYNYQAKLKRKANAKK